MIREEVRSMKKISMIVPCYNEEGNVELFYKDAVKTYKNSKDYEVELIFIDDGSKDDTLKNLKKLIKKKDLKVKVISFSRNFGKESVIYAGLKKATGDYTVIIDADMQQPPHLTLNMAQILDEGEFDCVCYYQKQRIESGLMSFVKRSFYKTMNKMTNLDMKEGASDFRMFKTNVKEAILSLNEVRRFTKGIFSYVGFDTKYLPYTPEKRATGESKWNPKGLLKYGITGIVSFSTAPLKIATNVGFLMSTISFIYLLVVLIQKLIFSIDIPGYATIIGLILLIGGIELLCIGIIGEYLSNMYLEIKNRPIYIVKEELENDK